MRVKRKDKKKDAAVYGGSAVAGIGGLAMLRGSKDLRIKERAQGKKIRNLVSEISKDASKAESFDRARRAATEMGEHSKFAKLGNEAIERIEKNKGEIQKAKELEKKLYKKAGNLGTAGKIALGTAIATPIAYGILKKKSKENVGEKKFSESREEVPKKIVKKAEKSGVIQKDSDGNWRIINMHGPGGKAVYWKPVYKSKESAEHVLSAYRVGAWNNKKK